MTNEATPGPWEVIGTDPADGGELETALDALKGAEAAIAEYYRYWTGGEMRGSYDGKPERDGLWKAQSKARAVIDQARALMEKTNG